MGRTPTVIPSQADIHGAGRARTVPAWMMSAVVHLVLLIALTSILRPMAKSITDEPDRAAAIVLARSNSDQNVEYLAEQDVSATATATAATQPTLADQPPPTLPHIQLPGTQADSLDLRADDLVVVPHLDELRRAPILPGLGDAEILAEDAEFQQQRGVAAAPVRVSVFGAPAEGRSFVFVIDRSKSMGGEGLGALAHAESELLGAVQRLTPDHEFQILAYHHQPTYLGPRTMLTASPENKELVPGFMRGLAAFGGTAHETALLAALRLKPDVIFLLTDGGSPEPDETQLDRIARRAAGRTSVHCIRFGFGPLQEKDGFMRKLAQANHGTFVYVDMSRRRDVP